MMLPAPVHAYSLGIEYRRDDGGVAILMALIARQRTGRGQWIEVSLAEAMIEPLSMYIERPTFGTAPVGSTVGKIQVRGWRFVDWTGHPPRFCNGWWTTSALAALGVRTGSWIQRKRLRIRISMHVSKSVFGSCFDEGCAGVGIDCHPPQDPIGAGTHAPGVDVV